MPYPTDKSVGFPQDRKLQLRIEELEKQPVARPDIDSDKSIRYYKSRIIQLEKMLNIGRCDYDPNYNRNYNQRNQQNYRSQYSKDDNGVLRRR